MRRRKVVLVHNHYQQPGGEDEVFRGESALLVEHGHTVVPYALDNRTIEGMARLTLATRTVWSQQSHRELGALFAREAPDVAHFHNTFPLVSPSAYYAARDAGVAVVQTLHNFRIICPGATFFRDGQVCEECLGKAAPWPAIVHACYRENRLATSVVAGMVTFHRGLGTWTTLVDVYVALSEFARRKFVAGGIPANRIVVKPNFLPRDPGIGEHRGRFALYVGRLSAEKGLDTLLDSWRRLNATTARKLTLKIAGGGPLADTAGTGPAGVEWLGWRAKSDVLALMRDAAFLIVPSSCYENFPMTIVEAFATGLPVIVSGHGAMAEIVADRSTGLHFAPSDPRSLAERIEWACDHSRQLRELGRAGRCEFERKYTAEVNHQALLNIYEVAARQLAA
jgi:glycosyltransferase involved in cell wall biosynthesis